MRQRKRVLAAVLSFLMLFGTDNSMNVSASEITGENLGSPMQSVEETETEAQIQEETESRKDTEEPAGTEVSESTEEQPDSREPESTGEQPDSSKPEGTQEQTDIREQTGTEVQINAEESRSVPLSDDVKQELKISYLVLQKAQIQTPDSQFVLLGYDAADATVTGMNLQYQNRETGEVYTAPAKELEADAALFSLEFQKEQTQGIYDLTGITYTTSDTVEDVQTIDFSETGITAFFGINEGVTPKPDAVITESEEEQPDVVMTDAAGNLLSKEGLEEAIGNACANTDADAVDATGGKKKIVVVLDPGHGGHDGGASYYGRLEKNLNLSIATYCKAELDTYGGVTVYMTRSGDNFVSLTDRAQIAANYGADIFVSIHNNACGNPSVSGASVYYPNSNYRPDLGDAGRMLASRIEGQLVSLGLAHRGILVRNCVDNTRDYIYPDGSHADYYHVIRECKQRGIAGLIVEHAYMTSYSDMVNYLSNEAQLQRLGIADATAIASYFNLKKGNSDLTLQSVSSKSSDSILLKWKENDFFDGYAVYRSEAKNGTYKKITQINNFSVTNYVDKKRKTGKKYFYKIVGIRGTTELGASGVKSASTLPGTDLKQVTAAGSRTLQLSWKKVNGVTGYEIYRSNSANGKYQRVKKIRNAKTLSWKDKTVKTGKKYYYRLRAYKEQKDATGYSSDSKKLCGSTIAATKITSAVSAKSGHCLLKWKKIAGAKKYQIYRSEKKDGKYRRIASTKNGKITSYSDKSAAAGKTYYYKVRVINYVNHKEGYSDDSNIVSGRQLASPFWKEIVSNDSSGITLSWKKVSGATGYRIYRSTAKNGSYKKIKTLKGQGVVKYIDKTGKKDQIYYYRIQAEGKKGESALSDKQWCRILSAPVLKSVLPQEAGIMSLSWDPAAHASGYIIYRAKDTDTSWEKIQTIEGTSVTTWQDASTQQGIVYQYRIQAYAVRSKGKPDQKTDYSNCSNVIMARHLEIPVLQLTEIDNHQVQLSWKKLAGVDTYRVFRKNEATGENEELDAANVQYRAEADSYFYTDITTRGGDSYTYSVQAVQKQEDQLAVSDLDTKTITLEKTVVE